MSLHPDDELSLLLARARSSPEAWREQAACRYSDTELFFPAGRGSRAQLQIAAAKAICANCSVRRPCLDYALSNGVDCGVYGGRSEDERRAMRELLSLPTSSAASF